MVMVNSTTAMAGVDINGRDEVEEPKVVAAEQTARDAAEKPGVG